MNKPLIRHAIGIGVCVLYLLFVVWAGWGWIVLLPLIVDYYFFKKVNWAWGRNHPNKLVRSSITILGDVLYVVITITFLFTFFFQNFGIPSSSLEKTMLTGDYLFVSKLKYGPRLPMTPIALPLVHNRLMDKETYSSSITLDYKRLAGYGEIERNDLVVFNFPAGDTVATKMTNPDYLTLCHLYGRDAVHTDKEQFGDIIYRPVDRRDHYVKRLIGMPGDHLEIINGQVYIGGKPLVNPQKMQFNYLVQTRGEELSKELLDALEINYRDVLPYPEVIATNDEEVASYKSLYGLDPINPQGGYGRIYEIPLTHEAKNDLLKEPYINKIVRVKYTAESSTIYPLGVEHGWTIDNYGPITIPQKGMTVTLTEANYPLYERCIRAYEGNTLEQKGGAYYINDIPSTSYTFKQNYYWMMGDNRHNSADSRAWGFVPEDHIVGTPSLLWLSLNDEQSLFNGRIRWSRMMRFLSSW